MLSVKIKSSRTGYSQKICQIFRHHIQSGKINQIIREKGLKKKPTSFFVLRVHFAMCKLEIYCKAYLKTISFSTFHLPLSLSSLGSLPCCSRTPSKTDLSYLWKDCEKQNLKKRSKNHFVYLSHSHAINYCHYVLSLVFVTPSSTASLFLPVVRGTQERLGSSKAINEIKSKQLWWLTAWGAMFKQGFL